MLLNVSSKPVDCARSSTARIASASGMQSLPTEMGTASATAFRKGTHMACLKRRGNRFAINRRVANTYLMLRGAFFRHRPGGEIATALLAIERLAASNAMRATQRVAGDVNRGRNTNLTDRPLKTVDEIRNVRNSLFG